MYTVHLKHTPHAVQPSCESKFKNNLILYLKKTKCNYLMNRWSQYIPVENDVFYIIDINNINRGT